MLNAANVAKGFDILVISCLNIQYNHFDAMTKYFDRHNYFQICI